MTPKRRMQLIDADYWSQFWLHQKKQKKRYDIEQNGVWLAAIMLAVLPLVWLAFGYWIEWWNR